MPSGTAGGRGPSAYPLVGTRVYHRRTMQRKPSDPQRASRPAFGRSKRSQLNVIDYTLAKRALLRDAQAGLQSVNELCDAHPELMRAARNMGEATPRESPICEDAEVVLVTFAFGSRLPAHGRCVGGRDELIKLARPLGVTGTVVVEASPWVEDNQWLLDLAAKNDFLLGVVGHLDLLDEAFPGRLERFAKQPGRLGAQRDLQCRLVRASFAPHQHGCASIREGCGENKRCQRA